MLTKELWTAICHVEMLSPGKAPKCKFGVAVKLSRVTPQMHVFVAHVNVVTRTIFYGAPEIQV